MPLIKSFRGKSQTFRGDSRGGFRGKSGSRTLPSGGFIGGVLGGFWGVYKAFSPQLGEISYILGLIYYKTPSKLAYFERFMAAHFFLFSKKKKKKKKKEVIQSISHFWANHRALFSHSINNNSHTHIHFFHTNAAF